MIFEGRNAGCLLTETFAEYSGHQTLCGVSATSEVNVFLR